jgi:hypothetical protein
MARRGALWPTQELINQAPGFASSQRLECSPWFGTIQKYRVTQNLDHDVRRIFVVSQLA